jgi:hypothetical protein
VIELRPSNAHRWLVCHGQPRASVGMPDRPSKYAERGTVAHALLELALRLDYDEEGLESFVGKTLKGEPPIEVDDKMIRGVGHAMDYVRSYIARNPTADYFLEHATSLTLGEYKIEGTSDVIIDNIPHELVIIDYKDGVVGVDEEENPQLTLYLLGHMEKHRKRLKPDTKFRLVIAQPNARDDRPPIRETVVDMKYLRAFREQALAAAHAAHDANALRVAGDHCRFCVAAGQCGTYAEYVLQEAALEFDGKEALMPKHFAEDLEPEQMARILDAADRIRAWINSVEEMAIQRLLSGDKIPGYKVGSSNPRRKWDDETKVMTIIEKSKLDVEVLAPRSPLSPAQLEKLYKKHVYPAKFQRAIAARITHNPVEPRVVPLTDKSKPYVAGSEFAEDV